MALIYSIANQKGGVGKTTVTLLLGDALAVRGKRVLLVDVDPQANLTDTLAPPEWDASVSPTLADVFADGTAGAAAGAIVKSRWGGIDLLPGDLQIARFDASRDLGSEHRLKVALAGCVDNYDYVLIDCPRALGPLTDAALVASHGLIGVAEPTRDAAKGLRLLMDTVDVISRFYNPGLSLTGVVLNRQGRTQTKVARAAEVHEALGATVWGAPLPEWAVVAKVVEYGVPLTELPKERRGPAAVMIVAGWADQLTSAPVQIGQGR